MATKRELEKFPSAEEVEDKISELGVNYTSRIWQLLRAADITLTPEQADTYSIIQKAHTRLTGNSLPQIKGAMKTRAQEKDEEGPKVKEEVIEKAVQGGLMAKLKRIREGK